MEIENRPINLPQSNPQARGVSILCAVCELSFIPSDTKTNICQQCILNTADITLGITKEGIINYCKFCHRYLRPPWTLCERESKELLSICLKRLRGYWSLKYWLDSQRLKLLMPLSCTLIPLQNVSRFVSQSKRKFSTTQMFSKHLWLSLPSTINNVMTVRRSSLHTHGEPPFKLDRK